MVELGRCLSRPLAVFGNKGDRPMCLLIAFGHGGGRRAGKLNYLITAD